MGPWSNTHHPAENSLKRLPCIENDRSYIQMNVMRHLSKRSSKSLPRAFSSSRNAVSNSSARTTKRLRMSRCAPQIQIVRPCESTADTHPKLHPALPRLSAMISQYFTGGNLRDL